MRLLLPLAFAAQALATMLLLRHSPRDVAIDLAQPLVVVTYWQRFGMLLALTLLAAIALGTIGYVAALRAHLRRKPVVALTALSCAAALLVPAIFSSDVYAYAAYGDMLLHGANPYVHAPVAFHNALIDASLWQWGDPLPACVYGAAFLPVAAFAAMLAPLGAAWPLWCLRVLACAALVACAWFGGRRAAVLTLNPLAIWSVAEGHNDVFAITAILCGLFIARKRTALGAFITGAAGGIKLPAVLALPAAVHVERRAASLGFALAMLLTLPVLAGFLANVAPHRTYAPHFSPAFVIGTVPAIAVALLLAAVSRFRVAACVFALWFCIPNPYPWYGVWLLTAAVFVRNRFDRAILIVAALLGALRYTGEGSSLLSRPLETALVALGYGIPALMVCAAGMARWNRGRREIRTAVPDLAAVRPR